MYKKTTQFCTIFFINFWPIFVIFSPKFSSRSHYSSQNAGMIANKFQFHTYFRFRKTGSQMVTNCYSECTRTHHFDINFFLKIQNIFWGGGTAPSPDPTSSGEGDTPSPHPTTLGASILVSHSTCGPQTEILATPLRPIHSKLQT